MNISKREVESMLYVLDKLVEQKERKEVLIDLMYVLIKTNQKNAFNSDAFKKATKYIQE